MQKCIIFNIYPSSQNTTQNKTKQKTFIWFCAKTTNSDRHDKIYLGYMLVLLLPKAVWKDGLFQMYGIWYDGINSPNYSSNSNINAVKPAGQHRKWVKIIAIDLTYALDKFSSSTIECS